MFRNSISSLAVLIAATIGAGIFSLPFVFSRAGFGVSSLLLVMLGFVIAATHYLYWCALQKEDSRANIFSLLGKYFGKGGSVASFVVMICELILAMGVLLAVGSRFTHLLFPFAPSGLSLFFFWFAGCFFLIKRERDSLRLETIAISGVILIVVFLSFFGFFRVSGNAISWETVSPFFAFGPILFALSGWTGIEAVRDESERGAESRGRGKLFFVSVGIVCVLYFLFAVAIARVSSPISPDTLSGVMAVGPWLAALLSLLGAIAILAAYFPLGLETRRLLASALRVPERHANLFIILFPLFFVVATHGDFIKILGVTGGIFVSLQYLLLLGASYASARFRGGRLLLWILAVCVFALAFGAEAYYLVAG